jgi:C4-dicarboxylate-specific signal transduction histidine kinase
VVAVLTFVCFRLRVKFPSFLYLTVVVLFSLTDAVLASITVSVLSVLCLDYFFEPPLFSLWVDDPLGIVTLVAFLAVALLISRLMWQRKRAEEALQKLLGELDLKVQERTAELATANDELRSEMNERRRAEEELQKAQAELAHVSRLTTLGELTASISHEVNQPIAGVVTNGQAALRWLGQNPPRLDEVRSAVERSVRDGNRASEIIKQIRALAKKTDPKKLSLDINDVIQEGIVLLRREILSQGVSLRTEFASELPRVAGDRIQLQQVIVNLIMNGAEAMVPVTDRPHEILIRSRQDDPQQVLVAVRDSGTGIESASAERLFKAFYTTKPGGMGMGLSICRSIIAAHGGRLWASPNADHGATFQFTLPVAGDAS